MYTKQVHASVNLPCFSTGSVLWEHWPVIQVVQCRLCVGDCQVHHRYVTVHASFIMESKRTGSKSSPYT